ARAFLVDHALTGDLSPSIGRRDRRKRTSPQLRRSNHAMATPPDRTEIPNGLDRMALGEALLQEGTRELERLRRVRGAHRRTARRIRRALAVVALAAGLLGVPLAGIGRAVPPAP